MPLSIDILQGDRGPIRTGNVRAGQYRVGYRILVPAFEPEIPDVLTLPSAALDTMTALRIVSTGKRINGNVIRAGTYRAGQQFLEPLLATTTMDSLTLPSAPIDII